MNGTVRFGFVLILLVVVYALASLPDTGPMPSQQTLLLAKLEAGCSP